MYSFLETNTKLTLFSSLEAAKQTKKKRVEIHFNFKYVIVIIIIWLD